MAEKRKRRFKMGTAMANFFNFSSKPKVLIRVIPPEVEMCIIKRLGKPKFWISSLDFNETMAKIYRKASSAALEDYYRQKSKRE